MFLITKLSGSTLFKTIAFNLIVVFIFTFVVPVYSQDTGAQLLRDGIRLYEAGELDEAIAKLSSCVERSDLNTAQKTEAYKFLAQAYMARDLRDQAKIAVEKLLTIMPNYKPDPIQDRPQYIELVETVKQERQQKVTVPEATPVVPAKKKSKKTLWILIGAGVVAGAVLAIVLWPSEEKAEDLPAPPDLPGGM